MRLSPTWPYVNRVSSATATRVAATVVPMPAYSSSAAARMKIARFASLIAVRMRLASRDRLGSNPYGQVSSVSACDRPMKVPIVSTAIRDATSPAWCPPMPSHTTRTPLPTRILSSFLTRRLPTSVRPQHRIILRGLSESHHRGAQPSGSALPAVVRSADPKGKPRDFGNPKLQSDSERGVESETVRLGDDLTADPIAVVQLGE